ncbi:hypothetical protein QBC34DRAFT_124036 [Podospora aff. communis PSN243]|uniref:Kelch repeat protein n=1 Tax=Podospora aff. communis PSN243 TaxID=3040156 RepID=A0AAV9GI82_9PEZI|nr:hypothetical protein QBC34DRAFT_124036 [Podospora aff. communis PSN243]
MALSDTPSVTNYVRRFSASAVVIGNHVYIDGGEITQYVNGSSTFENQGRYTNQVNSTLSLDLRKSWTTSDVVFRSIPKQGPIKTNVVLWPDRARNAFYSWGGNFAFGLNKTKPELWRFNADGGGGGKWVLESASNPEVFNGLTSAGSMAYTTVNNTGYAIGGHATSLTTLGREEDNGQSKQAIPGMLTYNFDTREWTNETASTGFSPFHTLTGASAHYVPNFGPGGLVFVLGGHLLDIDRDYPLANSPAQTFDNLTFFDPAAKKTYFQRATGDIPSLPRADSCVEGFQNTEGGYEILLFGGVNRATRNNDKYHDAYILSLPGFVWTKLPAPNYGARAYHSCVAVGKRQILSIGGMRTTGTDKDRAPQGLLLFDMTEWRWMDVYDTTLGAYERHKNITAWYAEGGLEKVQWSSDEVKGMFVNEGPGGGGPGEQEPSGSSTPVGAIAGGTIGGIVGLAAILGLLWFIIRRKRKHSEDGPERHTESQDASPMTRPPQQPAEVSSDSANTVMEKRPIYTGHAELPPKPAHAELPPNQIPGFAAELDGSQRGGRPFS